MIGVDFELLESARQLGIARSQLADAQARVRQAEALSKSPDRLTSVSDALQSKVIAEYRSQYAQIKRKHSQLAARLGVNHPQTADAQAELDSVNKEIELELKRIVEGARNNQEVAERHVRLLEEGIEQLRNRIEERERGMLDLYELDREAKAAGAFYMSLLTRLKETQAQETFQLSDARILSPALPPPRRADARPLFIVSLTTMLGFALGLSLVLVGNAGARDVRSRKVLASDLGLEPLGSLPLLGAAWPAHVREPVPHDMEAVTRYSLDHPRSAFARTIRTVLRTTVAAGTSKVVLVTSALEREGKTTLALNLARVAATGGHRTLLIEASLRSPALAKLLPEPPRASMHDVLRGDAGIADATVADGVPGLKFWPAPRPATGMAVSLDVAALGRTLAQLKADYDLIVIDAPAIIDLPEAKRLVPHADAVLMVIEWGATSREDVSAAIEAVGSSVPIVGAVMNRVPASEPWLWRWLAETSVGRQLEALRANRAAPRPTADPGAGAA